MEPMNIDVLRHKANQVAGREVEVEKTSDGEYIVLWMHFQQSPPPKGKSEAEALKRFIQYKLSVDAEQDKLEADDTKTEDTNESGDRTSTESNSDDSGSQRSEGQ